MPHEGGAKITRLERCEQWGRPTGLPPYDPLENIWAAFLDIGPCRSRAMGPEPLFWDDVLAYAAATGAVSEPWEYRALVRMSRAYLAERANGDDPLAIAPVDQEEDE